MSIKIVTPCSSLYLLKFFPRIMEVKNYHLLNLKVDGTYTLNEKFPLRYHILFSELWNKKQEEYYDRFEVMENLKIKESLRSAPLQDDEILGFHGNFKKLSVD